MAKCTGVTRNGAPCNNSARATSVYCRWHENNQSSLLNSPEECICCCEVVDTALDCGHWVHIDCVKRAADSLQEIRSVSGYPPLTVGHCPICRAQVTQVTPNPPSAVQPIHFTLSNIQLNNAMEQWRAEPSAPLQWYLWGALNSQFPGEQTPDIEQMMMESASILARILLRQTTTLDIRFQHRLERSW